VPGLDDTPEDGLSCSHHDRVHDEAELVEQALVDEARQQSRAAHDVHRLAGLLLQRPDLADVVDDPRVGQVGSVSVLESTSAVSAARRA
jgi:hypothetical protein